jgi:hypothetical protein
MSGMERPIRVEVDGEVFDVAARRDHPGQYDDEWTSGRNSGYGFFSTSSDGRPSTMARPRGSDPELPVTSRPETGYIE